ncbi:MAG: type I DNA topoisomerase [Succinivibrionaceae bacterium]
MGKSLVIVESPAKAHTINEILGSKFVVKSSVGHIRDLPKGQTKVDSSVSQKRAKNAMEKDQKLFKRMGIDPENGWKPQYEILPDKIKVVEELIKLAQKADYVYLATDLDREGEAIAWHLQEVIGLPPEKFKRVVFNEITKNAITEAFKNPGVVNIDMVNAQQTRRFLDRVVGFMLSPLLWEKVGRGLSAGRVQSVAVKLIVEKEKKIKSFVPIEYWNINADLLFNKKVLNCCLVTYKGKEFSSSSKSETDKHLDLLSKAEFEVVKAEQKERSVKTPAPFTTSSLQQAASTRLGFSVKKTMMLAQNLYESGFITYMRTDSTNLSADAIVNLREVIEKQYGKEYLPASPKRYAAKDNAQNAHEAIRTTDANRTGADLVGMDKDAIRLYDMIRNQVLACQMENAIVITKEILIGANDYNFKLTGKITKFDGWYRVINAQKDQDIPDLKVGDKLTLQELLPSQHYTRPEARYTEASLVSELEKRGIGRPSTYATIISTIQERGYVKVEQRRFFAEKMGEIVTDRLDHSFNDLMDYDFTKEMETELDEIAESKLNWISCLDNFYSKFKKELDCARLTAEEGGMENNKSVETTILCPDCHHPMVIKNATTGVFLACSNYNGKTRSKTDSCRKTLNLVPVNELPMFLNDDSESEFLRSKKRCLICSSIMDSYILNEHTKVHICSNNPNCSGYEIEEGEFKIKGADGPVIVCERCGHDMVLKSGRFGNYMACTNDECKNTRKILKNGDIAPPKEDPVPFTDLICKDGKSHFVFRDGASGVFLASSAFPKVRETRPPKVAELIAHKELLPKKFLYLTEAPETDEKGNLTVVRFSRKTKQQYVSAETPEGKSSGFTSFYIDGKWQVTSEKSTKKSSSVTKKKTTKKNSSK